MNTEKTGNILVVDDEQDIVEILVETLSCHFKDVTGASNGKEALELHKVHNYDVIISDLKMPVMSGLELLSALREMEDETPFIILTAYSDLDASITALRLGAFNFYSKPFDGLEIVDKVKEALIIKDLNKQAEKDATELMKSLSSNNYVSKESMVTAKYVSFMKLLRKYHNNEN